MTVSGRLNSDVMSSTHSFFFFIFSILIAGLPSCVLAEVESDTSAYESLNIAWGEQVNGLRLGLTLNRSDFQKGEIVEFTAYLKNDGKASTNIPGFFFGLEIPAIRIYDADGNEIGFVKENLEIHIGSDTAIRPGDILAAKQTITLNKTMWEGDVGTYRVIAVYDTRSQLWGNRQDLQTKPRNYWIGTCESAEVSLTVKAK